MWRSAGLLAAATACAACGVAFEGSGAGGGGPLPAGSGGAANGTPSASSGAAGSGSATSASQSSGSAATGGAGGVGGAGAQAGAGGTPPLLCPSPDTVCCAGAPCPLPQMECCATSQSALAQAQCVPFGTCPSSQLEIQCDDSEDCNGDFCCSTWTGSQHLQIVCAAVCTPPSNLGAAGTYPMCSFPNGNCDINQTCHNDCCVGSIGIGYCD